jgi:hypothetical protein
LRQLCRASASASPDAVDMERLIMMPRGFAATAVQPAHAYQRLVAVASHFLFANGSRDQPDRTSSRATRDTHRPEISIAAVTGVHSQRVP